MWALKFIANVFRWSCVEVIPLVAETAFLECCDVCVSPLNLFSKLFVFFWCVVDWFFHQHKPQKWMKTIIWKYHSPAVTCRLLSFILFARKLAGKKVCCIRLCFSRADAIVLGMSFGDRKMSVEWGRITKKLKTTSLLNHCTTNVLLALSESRC